MQQNVQSEENKSEDKMVKVSMSFKDELRAGVLASMKKAFIFRTVIRLLFSRFAINKDLLFDS